jgi:DNA polymerase III subunit epsilon
MNWLAALLRRGKPALGEQQRAALRSYRLLERPNLDAPAATQRAVVVDVEASGLDPRRDRLLSIGAIGVLGGLARYAETFEVVLRQARPSETHNILVHGIGGSAQLAGREAAEGLLDFLAFAGKAPLVAFHADFDRILVERAIAPALGIKPGNLWLDLALLAPALFPDQPSGARTLDDWLRRFGIGNDDRHNALADALATAQLLLVALAQAGKQGLTTWAQLAGLQEGQRWISRARRIF